MADYPFFAYLYRLRYIERWSLMRNMVKENVAEHSYHVAVLVHVLCTIANEIYEKNVDTGAAVSAALFHDITETFTGDIPTPIKHHNPEILKNFRDIEQKAAERLSGMIPEPLRSIYEPMLKPAKNENTDIRSYVKAADLLDAYLKCESELSAGNGEFAVAKKQIEQSIKKLGMPETDYFLSYLAPSFEKTLDEMARIDDD